MSAGLVILILKVAVITVTVLLVASLAALWRGNYRLHGRINLAFFILTSIALLGLEVVARLLNPEMFDRYFEQDPQAKSALTIHLGFSIPAAMLLPFMYFTGWKRKRQIHLVLACVFLVLWTGTFITGVFFLPHHLP